MSDEGSKGFESDRTVDSDGVVGARWWNQALIEADRGASRRGVFKVLGIGALTAVTCGVVCSDSCEDGFDPDDYRFERRRSLELQKQYGWDFGAAGDPLVFDGATTSPFDPASIATIEQDLAPPYYASLHVPTLLQSPNATPTSRPAEETVPFEPLAKKLRPISTPRMTAAYAAGEALSKLLAEKSAPVAIFVDMDGPESVAFAAGAAGAFEPVFLLDNWPHPHGVVPSHLALAAAVFYQPRFVKTRGERQPWARPVFVLDRLRMSTYTDSITTFDNRYTARVPSPPVLQAASPGIQWILYVVRQASDLPELDDLNQPLLAYTNAGVPVRALSLDMFAASPSGTVRYEGSGGGGDAAPVDRFYSDYPLDGGGVGGGDAGSGKASTERSYRPSFRSTPLYSTPSPDFGTTPIVLAAATGAVLGSRYDRRGSWNRTGG